MTHEQMMGELNNYAGFVHADESIDEGKALRRHCVTVRAYSRENSIVDICIHARNDFEAREQAVKLFLLIASDHVL